MNTKQFAAAFATGFAAMVPAWALAMLMRSPGWVPVLSLAAAVLWLRVGVVGAGLTGTATGMAPARHTETATGMTRAGLAGSAAGVTRAGRLVGTTAGTAQIRDAETATGMAHTGHAETATGIARVGLAGVAAGVVGVGVAIHPGVLVLLVILGGAAVVRRRAEIHELPAGAAEEARRVRRLFRLATSTSDSGEVRVLGLGPYLLAEHDRATRVVLAARGAAARRAMLREWGRGLAVAGTVLGTVLITVWLGGDGAALIAAAWAAAVAGHWAYR